MIDSLIVHHFCKLSIASAIITIKERLQRKEGKMPTLVSCVIGIGFIALATILVIRVARDVNSPTEGRRIHEALAHLEKTLQD